MRFRVAVRAEGHPRSPGGWVLLGEQAVKLFWREMQKKKKRVLSFFLERVNGQQRKILPQCLVQQESCTSQPLVNNITDMLLIESSLGLDSMGQHKLRRDSNTNVQDLRIYQSCADEITQPGGICELFKSWRGKCSQIKYYNQPKLNVCHWKMMQYRDCWRFKISIQCKKSAFERAQRGFPCICNKSSTNIEDKCKQLLSGAATIIYSMGVFLSPAHVVPNKHWGNVNLARQMERFLTPSDLSHWEIQLSRKVKEMPLKKIHLWKWQRPFR